MRITRRHLQVSLGALWLLDGALQCQPSMFGPFFTHQILAPARDGLPSLLAGPLHTLATIVSSQPALANAGFAIIQIALGVGLLTRRFTRLALGASIAWALMVWIAGEGLGGITTGATIPMGAPGAALIYAVIAILAWPTREEESRARPSWLALPAWCALWLMGALLQLVGGNNSSMSLTMMLRNAQSSSPGWIAALDHRLSLLRIPTWAPAALIGLFILIAMWSLVPGGVRRVAVALGVVISLTSWLFFQGLGDLTSGQSTDPNSGPLVVLLAVAVLGASNPREIRRHPLDTLESSDTVVAPSLVESTR